MLSHPHTLTPTPSTHSHQPLPHTIHHLLVLQKDTSLEAELVNSLSLVASTPHTSAPASSSGAAGSWLPGWQQGQPQQQQQHPSSPRQYEVLSPVLPGEQQQREAAQAVQSLLVQGKKQDAFKVGGGRMGGE